VWLEGLGKLEKSTTSGFELATFWLVTQCLNKYPTTLASKSIIKYTSIREDAGNGHVVTQEFLAPQ
jgi:hypothetical protein